MILARSDVDDFQYNQNKMRSRDASPRAPWEWFYSNIRESAFGGLCRHGFCRQGEGSLSGSRHSRQQRARRVRWFTHETHRGRAGTGVYRNMLGPRRKSHRDLADRSPGVGRISSALADQTPSVLEPERMVNISRIIHVNKGKSQPYSNTSRRHVQFVR